MVCASASQAKIGHGQSEGMTKILARHNVWIATQCTCQNFGKIAKISLDLPPTKLPNLYLEPTNKEGTHKKHIFSNIKIN